MTLIGALIEGVRFATDSPLEEEGFEPSVPRMRDSPFPNSLKRRAMIRGPTRNQGRFPAQIS